MDRNDRLGALASARIAVDIGSTVVKIARLGDGDVVLAQHFHPRDFESGIARQVEALLRQLDVAPDRDDILICSSANGGLRVGLVCLTEHFSGTVLRNQVLMAGANPVFLHHFGTESSSPPRVDMLIVGGGIDTDDAGPLEMRLRQFDPAGYRFGTLAYAGNRHLAPAFLERFPYAIAIDNPLADSLSGRRSQSVFEAVRRAYLDDLIYKEGVSELRASLAHGIRPTPEVVNHGFHRLISTGVGLDHGPAGAMADGESREPVAGACVLLDIGGATTDVHYTVEIVKEDSDARPPAGSSVGRYVFTDLGTVASRESLLLQLRTHPRLYQFLDAVLDEDVRDAYRVLREGDYQAPPEVLSYGCLFLALDRFERGQGPGLPAAHLAKVTQVILTGGAAQPLSESRASRLLGVLVPDAAAPLPVTIDRAYRIWLSGITWPDRAAH